MINREAKITVDNTNKALEEVKIEGRRQWNPKRWGFFGALFGGSIGGLFGSAPGAIIGASVGGAAGYIPNKVA